MDVTESADAEPEVYFVSCGSEGTSLNLFKEAFQACKDSEIEPKQLSSENCLQLTPSARNDIFVLDSFDTDVYTHLQSHSARIYGAPCVLHCLTNSEDLPGEDHPVYSMCMSGALVTFTGVPTADRPDVVKKIGWLGATFTKGLIKSTTHLIALEASSKKYHAAVGLKIPVLTLDWLNDSLEKSKTQLFDAKDSDYISKYICPVFLGCVITTSNIVEKNKIKEIIERGGGKYSGQMAFKECTHLIIERPEGQKYTMAQKWGSVRIVSPLWVYDCERTGYRILEDQMSKYSIRKASTPSKEEFKSPNPPDVSAIHSSTFSVSHIDETRTSVSSTSRKSAEGDNSTSPTRTCDALAGCKVCIRGFDEKRTESLSSMITHCGGTRSLSTVQADYVVILQLDDDTKQHIKSIRQPVVSSEWLKKVHSTQALVDVEGYLLYRPSKKRHASNDDTLPVTKSFKLSPDDSLSADQTMLDTEVLDNGDTDQLLSQYGGGTEVAAAIAPISRNDTSATTESTLTSMSGAAAVENAVTPLMKQQPDLHMPFQGLRFSIDPQVSVKERDAVAITIGSHGGTITDSDGTTHYLIMPLLLKQKTEARSKATLASTVWVRACDRVCRLLPVESNTLFTPVFSTNSQCVSGCVVTTTGLSAPERDAICGLMAAGGGRYFEDLRKLPGALLPATTHLVCESTESAKYKAARNWGLNIVSISWLTDSIKAGLCQPIEPYHPLKVKASAEAAEKRTLASLQTPVHSRIQALRFGQASSSQRKGSDKHYLSTSILDEPDKPFQPKFDVSCFDTPGAATKQPTSNTPETPLDVAMEKYMQIAVSKHCIPTPDLTQPSSAADVLAGCVVCLSKKLSAQSDHLSQLVMSLGGQFRTSYDVKATHLVFQGKTTDAEYRSAKRTNQLIVCPAWIERCAQEKKRVAESLYPHNYKEDRALQEIDNSTPSRRSQRSTQAGSCRNFTSNGTQSNAAGIEASEETQTSTAETLQVYRQIKDYMTKRRVTSNQPKKSVSTDMQAVTTGDGDSSVVCRPKETHVFQSQNDMLVTWDDTTSRDEAELEGNADADLDSEVMAQMDEDFTQDKGADKPPASQDMSSDYTLDVQDHHVEASVKDDSILQPARIFQFSGFSDQERDEIANKLKSLGERVLAESNFDVGCTHLILHKPQRNEKFLCSLVKGLWVLNRSFVDASVQEGKLVSEMSHEWGNPEATYPVSGSAVPYADACRRRRLAMQGGQEVPVFSSWKVILSLSKEKMSSMKKILELGGAEVISCSALPEDTAQLTHAFIDLKKSALSREDIQLLQGEGVPCLKVEYIPARLMNPSTLDMSKYSLCSTSARSSSNSSTLRKSSRQRSAS